MHLFDLLACVGAVSFFMTGYLLHAVRARAAVAEALSHFAAGACRDRQGFEFEIARFAAQCESLSAEAAGLRRQLWETGSARARSEEDVANLRIQLAQAAETTRTLVSERELREEAERAHLEARASLTKASKELAEARRLLSGERTSRARCEQQAGAARTAVRALEGERAQLLSRLEIAESRVRDVEELEQGLKRLREENARQRAEMSELVKAAGEKRTATAIDPELLQARLDMAIAQIQRVRNEDDELRVALAQAQLESTHARHELEGALARAADVDRLRAECHELRQGLDVMADDLAAAQRRLADAGADVEAAERRAIAAEALCEEATQKRALVEAELRTMRGRTRAAEAQTVEIERLRGECDSLRDERARRVEVERTVASLQAELRDVTIKLRTTESKLAALEALRAEHAALREQCEASGDAVQMLAVSQAEVRELRLKLQAADPKLAQLERVVEENRVLREQAADLADYQRVCGELERITTEHKRLRLECEIVTRRAQELEDERTELFELRSRVEELGVLAGEAAALRKREAQLEAQLFAAGHQPQPAGADELLQTAGSAPPLAHSSVTSGAHPIAGQQTGDPAPAHASGPAPSSDSELESALRSLADVEGVRTIALADGQGLLVASVGDRTQEEGLAALAGLADEFATRARSLLPLGNVLRVCLEDGNQIEASCRLFTTGGVDYGLTTIARPRLSPQQTDDAVANLSRVLAAHRAPLDECAIS